jgi:hypothetical protein
MKTLESQNPLAEGTVGSVIEMYEQELSEPQLSPLDELTAAVMTAFELGEGEELTRFYSFNRTVGESFERYSESGERLAAVTGEMVLDAVIRRTGDANPDENPFVTRRLVINDHNRPEAFREDQITLLGAQAIALDEAYGIQWHQNRSAKLPATEVVHSSHIVSVPETSTAVEAPLPVVVQNYVPKNPKEQWQCDNGLRDIVTGQLVKGVEYENTSAGVAPIALHQRPNVALQRLAEAA